MTNLKAKILNIANDMAGQILPARIAGLIGSPTTFCLGVIESGTIAKDTLLGMAVVSRQSETSYAINYLKKSPDSGDEVYETLLDEIENHLRLNRAKSIVARIIDTPYNLIEAVNALDTAGFVPVNLKGHFLTYSYKQILGTPFHQLIDSGKIQKYYSKVKNYDELDSRQISLLSGVLKSQTSYGKTFAPNKQGSKYYVTDNEVRGMVDVIREGEASFFIKSIYFSPGKESKIILPTLMASVLTDMYDYCNDNGVLSASIYNKAVYNWFQSAFGVGITDLNIFEYVKIL